MEEFVVYILFSDKFNKTYVGYTSNLIERFKSPNSLKSTMSKCVSNPSGKKEENIEKSI